MTIVTFYRVHACCGRLLTSPSLCSLKWKHYLIVQINLGNSVFVVSVKCWREENTKP